MERAAETGMPSVDVVEPRWPQDKSGSRSTPSEARLGGVRAPSSEPSLPSEWCSSTSGWNEMLKAGGADAARIEMWGSYQLDGAVNVGYEYH